MIHVIITKESEFHNLALFQYNTHFTKISLKKNLKFLNSFKTNFCQRNKNIKASLLLLQKSNAFNAFVAPNSILEDSGVININF